jgi:transcriptional regulator with XRE-family HTH domain
MSAEERALLCERIRSARREAKLSQTDLARQLGVTPSAAAQWEHLRGTSPGLQRMQAIARVTKVNFQWLITGHGLRRKNKSAELDTVSAVKFDLYAQDAEEELLLLSFRSLSVSERATLSSFLAAVAQRLR